MGKFDKWAHNFIISCLHKKSYKTAAFAEEIARKVERERGVKLYCYWCKNCGSYHLTSRPPKNKQENRERIF